MDEAGYRRCLKHNHKWTWGVLPHNCATFVEELVAAGLQQGRTVFQLPLPRGLHRSRGAEILLTDRALTFYTYFDNLYVGILPMDPRRSDLLQGTLDLVILKTVAHGPIHGYGIAQRIRETSKEVLKVQQGSLYPALHRLERKGWLRSEWKESASGRYAKFYKLTPVGRRQLQVETWSWKRFSEAIGLILRNAD